MLRHALVLSILSAAVIVLVSCSAKPDYDEDQPADVDRYFNDMQNRVVANKGLPIKSIYKEYEGTELSLIDNRDVAKGDHTPFVTKYDPITKVNVGPGHVPDKTKWCPTCEAEVSISEVEPHFHWQDEKTGKQMHTRYSYLEDREVGSNHVYKKTKFSREAKREVGEDFDIEKTTWCPLCQAEVGEGHDCDFTRYCPTSSCEKDIAKYGHEHKGEIHYGHVCALTDYSHVWMVDMFRKELAIYEKVPSSKIDYVELDKKRAPDRQPRIAEPDGELLQAPVPWVEDRKVVLTRDDLDRIRLSQESPSSKWKWNNPRSKELMLELAPKPPTDEAKKIMEYTKNAKDPDYKWKEEKEKEE